ncbi:hypothetical protein [Fimbriimonas ginsengisoli]|uniref:Uncharacterized protein n=1 Tax=Fimbriimonas ginsengisoli Gsoil 348 TaxID=661478 RepID=A0A068NJ10_FIMGI|nr:hypothetical protein [Fimbriimonas ginsengisoli]AIE83501.1 hypothetical protein OP10G_0133 [Fimbriimonas ginsengisoli Gsoil 348]
MKSWRRNALQPSFTFDFDPAPVPAPESASIVVRDLPAACIAAPIEPIAVSIEPLGKAEHKIFDFPKEPESGFAFHYFPDRPVVCSSVDMAREALTRHRDHALALLSRARARGDDESWPLRSLAFYQRQLTAILPPKPRRVDG